LNLRNCKSGNFCVGVILLSAL